MNKREIFLSFRPEFFRPILYDIKKYEYRKKFCKEPTRAFLYLSAPFKKVVGVVEFGMPLIIRDEIKKYTSDSIIYKRLSNNLECGEEYAIPIESLQLFKTPVSIEKIKNVQKDFCVPRCYMDIRRFEKAYEFLNEQFMYEVEFINLHEKVYENNLGMSCREMELTDEFKEKDEKYLGNVKYNMINVGYVTR